jgi:hypothetical protein
LYDHCSEQTKLVDTKGFTFNFSRNCLLGKAYHIKICDFGSDSPEFRRDYAEMEDGLLLPVRWMAWESVIEVYGILAEYFISIC